MRAHIQDIKAILVVVAILSLVGLSAYSGAPRQISLEDKVKEATFEVNVQFAFLALPKTGWEAAWPEFAAQTGATLISSSPGMLIFYVGGGGTAWWIGQSEYYAFALTAWHVVDIDSARADVEKAPAYGKVIESILRGQELICPNWSHLDTFPTCSLSASITLVFGDFVLDFAVIRFNELGRNNPNAQGITTLPLAPYEGVKEGTKVMMVGAPLGIEDRVIYGQTTAARAPYYFESPTWRWVVPVDMNTVGGYSGSPVVDISTGRAIGILRGAVLDPRGSGLSISLMVPMDYIARALIVNGYPVDYSGKLTEE